MQKKRILLVVAAMTLLSCLSSCADESNGSGSNFKGFSNQAGSVALGAAPVSADCDRISTGVNGDLNGFSVFPSDNPWNTDISNVVSDPNSSSLIAAYQSRVGANPVLQGDFGPEYGEVYNVVDSSTQPTQMMDINGYPSESDIMPIPLPNDAVVEGGSQKCANGGDCHMFILDRSQCWLYETWMTTFDGNQWHASNVAVWDMLNTSKRPYGWTSADAAGLAVFAGLLRYDEAARGVINHAIRFTMAHTGNSFVAPATHSAGYDTTDFPMGTRFRLKANVDISSFSPMDQVILTAMKKYGLILADTGLDLEIAGVNDSRWANSDVVALKNLHLTDFEVLPQTAPTKASVPAGAHPSIGSFTASATVLTKGQGVTLSFSTANDSWDFIDVLGPVRGNSVTVYPTATTTYTLNATNAFGRASQSVTVQVQ